jgi:hypothetical protein
MLPLPESCYTSSEVLASWIELSLLAEDDGLAVRGTVAETLRDSGLFDDRSGDSSSSDRGTVDAPSTEKVGEVWRVLQSRQAILGPAWPFDLTADRMTRKSDRAELNSVAAYTAMLLIEAATLKWYGGIAIQSGDGIRTWFEHIATASIGSLLGGRAVRFGAPFPSDWPRGFPARVERLAGMFDCLHRPQDIETHASPQQQDDSLDIVARWKLGDEAPSSACVLVQCATGANWRTAKPGQPNLTTWRRYVSWTGPTLKAIAVPFALRGPDVLTQASVAHGDAVVFDRLRLAAGRPDEHIDATLRSDLERWCRQRLGLLLTSATTANPAGVASRSRNKKAARHARRRA